MRRITLWLFSTVVALVLLFSYRTSTDSQASATPTTINRLATTPTTSATPTRTSTSTTGPATATSPATAATTSGAATSYTGSAASTRWGDVQVSITVTNGKITDVAVPVFPSNNGRDQEINAYALPLLRQETLTAQNANINTISGATVTSKGYLQSLQSALDAAHLA